MSNENSQPMKRGFVKQVLSGDTIVLQGPVTSGPPKEITVYLANVVAPRLAKRPNDSAVGTSDEAYAWEAREWLRKKIVGKTVVFVRDFLATSGREHGRIYLGGTSIENAENISESGISEGWLEVRPGKQIDENMQKFLSLQESAKTSKKGRWADDGESHVRDVKWQIEDARLLVDAYKQKPIDAVVEQVRDGSTVRAFLMPNFEYITVAFSGIRAPSQNNREGKSEEYGEEARYFVESRLLQRDVKIILEGVSNQNFIGSVVHPKGNIAEFLLKEGLAKCVDWSLGLVTGGPQKLREAQRFAKEKKLRLWKNYVSTATTGDKGSFNARVLEAGIGDSLTVLKDEGEELKIYLSSIRPPRRDGAAADGSGQAAQSRQFRPLYDIPHAFDAREFLRKRIVGKKVQVTVDYIQPKSDQFPEKTYCTVLYGQTGQNIGIQLVSAGYGKVIRHRQDDDSRSPYYDELLNAESEAERTKKGMWNDAEKTALRVQELQGEVARAKQFLPYLQRASRNEGVVEFVASGSRLRVYVPKETCVITFLLSGINCPRGPRMGPGGKPLGEGEPFADEAHKFTKTLTLQHDVEFEVEAMDKTGGFIGYLFARNEKGVNVNLAEALVEQGLASVHFTAERSKYYNQLLSAETAARNARRNLWKDYVEDTTTEDKEKATDVVERRITYTKVLVSDVQSGNLQFAVQNLSDGPVIEKLMNDLQSHLGAPGTVSNYVPRRGDLVACYVVEYRLWHRARVESVKGSKADVLYIDFGNRENVDVANIVALPPAFISQKPLCREYKLAFVSPPNDKDFAAESDAAIRDIVFGPTLELNTEYKLGTLECATLYLVNENGRIDIGKQLVTDGLLVVENRREKRFQSLIAEYAAAEKEARSERRNIWRYGDFTGSEF